MNLLYYIYKYIPTKHEKHFLHNYPQNFTSILIKIFYLEFFQSKLKDFFQIQV